MYNKIIVQPENLSEKEWSVLQHLATLTDYFHLADASLGFTSTSATIQVSNTLQFKQYFDRLKTTGYLTMQPTAFAGIKQVAQPLYALSALGKKVTYR